MKYSNRLKGSVTQSLLRSLLADSGYTVAPLGIEEAVREVGDLSAQQYAQLALPQALRSLPDFLILDRDRSNSWLTEVKFRAQWNDAVRAELETTLTTQAQFWAPFYVMIFLGTTASQCNPDTPAAWIRCGKVELSNNQLMLHQRTTEAIAWRQADWASLWRVQDTFPALNDPEKWNQAVIESTLIVSRALNTI